MFLLKSVQIQKLLSIRTYVQYCVLYYKVLHACLQIEEEGSMVSCW